MLKKIAKLLDFNIERMGVGHIIEEFNHKYRNSWLLINNTPMLITKLKTNMEGKTVLLASSFTARSHIVENVESIQAVHPKTGLYANGDTLIYLYRTPYRQWTKGFALGQNYKYSVLEDNGKDIYDTTVAKIALSPESDYAEESLIFQDKVYLHWKKVGTFNEPTETIHLSNNRFLKEIEELWKPLAVTLDAKYHKNVMEEKLMLDF